MSYYYSKIIEDDFDNTLRKTEVALKQEGFGILTEIDVKETLKKKYKILGACNPPYAYKALQAEDKIGAMLPCNVIVIEQNENKIEVAAVDPVSSMQAVKNDKLFEIADEIKAKLKKVVDSLS